MLNYVELIMVIDLINNIIYLPPNERFLANPLMGFMPPFLLNIA